MAVSQYSRNKSPYTWVKLIASGINLADTEPYMWVINDLQILQSMCSNLIYIWCKDEQLSYFSTKHNLATFG